MILRELLELCNEKLYLLIEDTDGAIITPTYTQIDDYFAMGVYRQYDDREVDFIDSDKTDISNLPTLFISLSEDIYG